MKSSAFLCIAQACLFTLCGLVTSTVCPAQAPAPITPANSALELQAAAQLFHRNLSYRQAEPVFGVRPFGQRVAVAPALALDLAVYPFAFRATRIWSHLGLRAGYQQLLATDTQLFSGTPDRQRVDSAMWKLELGLRGRIPIAEHAVGLSLLVARHSFGVEDVTLRGTRGAVIPSVRYDALKLAVDARLYFASFTLWAELGTRFVGDTGDLQRRWQRVDKTRVLELSAALSYRLQRHLDLRLGFGLLRYAVILARAREADALHAQQLVELELFGSLGLCFLL